MACQVELTGSSRTLPVAQKTLVRDRLVADLDEANSIGVRQQVAEGVLEELKPMAILRLKMMGAKKHPFRPMDGWVLHANFLFFWRLRLSSVKRERGKEIPRVCRKPRQRGSWRNLRSWAPLITIPSSNVPPNFDRLAAKDLSRSECAQPCFPGDPPCLPRC